MKTARHEEISRTFRRLLDEHRRFDLEKSEPVEVIAHRLHRVVAQRDVALHVRPAEIDVAIFHPQALVDVDIALHGKRRRERPVEHGNVGCRDLDLTGGQLLVLGARRPEPNPTADHDDVFGSERRGGCRRGGSNARVEDRLRDSKAVANVDEDELPVIASARDPTADFGSLAFVSVRELAAIGAQNGIVGQDCDAPSAPRNARFTPVK
jgi:hypothetical protein